MTRVDLTAHELAICGAEAAKRDKRARQRGADWLPDARMSAERQAALDLLGACGEMVAAKAIGLRDVLLGAWWATRTSQGSGPDLPPDIEVKTGKGDGVNLLVTPGDFERGGKRYILVQYHGGVYGVVGWADHALVRGRATLVRLRPDRPPVWLVQRNDLHPLTSFVLGLDWARDLDV